MIIGKTTRRTIEVVSAILGAALSLSAGEPPARGIDLGSLLEKAAEYCRKLDSAALEFVCREEIRETINAALDDDRPDLRMKYSGSDYTTYIGRREKSGTFTYVYDYQCVRKDGGLRETRTLIEENGLPTNQRNAKLKTSVFLYTTALLGPVGLFGRSVQRDFEYRISGEETMNGRPAVIIEAEPKPGTAKSKFLYGKAWIDTDRGDILKIEWDESRVGRSDIFKQRGKRYGMTPRITIRSEFREEKNGLRFPSEQFLEEAYLDKKGRPFVRSTTRVTYTGFKFFTVEVEIK